MRNTQQAPSQMPHQSSYSDVDMRNLHQPMSQAKGCNLAPKHGQAMQVVQHKAPATNVASSPSKKSFIMLSSFLFGSILNALVESKVVIVNNFASGRVHVRMQPQYWQLHFTVVTCAACCKIKAV